MERFFFIVVETVNVPTKDLNQMLDVHGEAGYQVVAVVGTRIIMQHSRHYPEVI